MKHLKTIGTTDTWITPKYITEALGHFDLDPCCHTKMPWMHADNGYTYLDDGLRSHWNGRVWVNPPFHRNFIGKWMAKMALHKNGILMIPFAGETSNFKKYVYPFATGILIIDGRVRYYNENGIIAKGNVGRTVCLISYDEKNLQSLIESNLGTVLNVI